MVASESEQRRRATTEYTEHTEKDRRGRRRIKEKKGSEARGDCHGPARSLPSLLPSFFRVFRVFRGDPSFVYSVVALCSASDYSGMLPCLRHGLSSFLSRSIARERQMRLRVSCGMMTSSMKPRWPAMK